MSPIKFIINTHEIQTHTPPVSQFFEQVEASNTDAYAYLTVYPIDGYEVVTDAAIDEMAQLIGNVTKGGRRVFLRYASEMNGEKTAVSIAGVSATR